jgi:ribosome-associated protein
LLYCCSYYRRFKKFYGIINQLIKNNIIKKNKKVNIPFSELIFEFSRSSGSGGQNINKVNTKVGVRWRFRKSLKLCIKQKALISKKLKNYINERGELIVFNQSTRLQVQNKKQAIQKLNELVNKALYIPPKRKPTKPSRSVIEKRLREKKIISKKKASRRRIEPNLEE